MLRAVRALILLLPGLALVGFLAGMTAPAHGQDATGAAPASPPPDQVPREDVAVETLVTGLEHPWGLAFLPDGSMLVTERPGRLRVVRDGSLAPQPVAGVPPVYAAGQGGLLDVVLHPDFADNQLIYLAYAHGTRGAATTRVARARFGDATLTGLQVVFEAVPLRATAAHFGARLAFLPDGTFVIGLGDGFNYRESAQRLDDHLGTVVRLNADGTVPADNPFVDRAGALAEIFSYGHRNIQGVAFDPVTATMVTHEHGPRGGDEINYLEAAGNYGWPLATYGIDYSGAIVSPYQGHPGTLQPALHWTPSIAPSGLAVYDGALFPDWQGDLLVGALAGQHLRRVIRDSDGAITGETALLTELAARIRDVRIGPDGAIYVLTDAPDGALLRLTPR